MWFDPQNQNNLSVIQMSSVVWYLSHCSKISPHAVWGNPESCKTSGNSPSSMDFVYLSNNCGWKQNWQSEFETSEQAVKRMTALNYTQFKSHIESAIKQHPETQRHNQNHKPVTSEEKESDIKSMTGTAIKKYLTNNDLDLTVNHFPPPPIS